MTKYVRITFIIFGILFAISFYATARAEEPERPRVDFTFSKSKEQKITEISSLSIENCFTRLKDIDFVIDENLMYKAIYSSFAHRRSEAINYAMNYLSLPIKDVNTGVGRSRTQEFYVAKKVLHVFPDEAAYKLLELYGNSDPVTRGNIIRVLGRMANGQSIRNLLIDALDDKTPCEERYPEMSGEPLRVCDVAYNQLVLRYKIQDVLRTIGTVHKIEIRDYHINILRDRL